MKTVQYTRIIKPYFSKMDEVEIGNMFLECFKEGKVHIVDDTEGDNLYVSNVPDVPLEIYSMAFDEYEEENESYAIINDEYEMILML